MSTRVLKIKMVTDMGMQVLLKCHVDGNVLKDVTMDSNLEGITSISVLQTLTLQQRDEIVRRCSKHLGFDVVVPHIRPGQLGKLIAIAKNSSSSPGFTKPEDCDHKFVAAVICELEEFNGLEHLRPKQLRCMTCGASFVKCENHSGVFHRLGEECS